MAITLDPPVTSSTAPTVIKGNLKNGDTTTPQIETPASTEALSASKTTTTTTTSSLKGIKSINLSHHINTLSKNRHPSPLKHILAYMARDGMVSLAGGLPHPSLFVFQSAHIEAYSPLTNPSSTIPSQSSDLVSFSIPKSDPSSGVDLNRALQYGNADGLPALRTWARKFTNDVYDPAYDDFEVILHNGNTDAWTKVVRLLCEPGDYILTEYQTFPSSMAVWTPMGCKAVPIKMDQHGMRSDHLEQVLTNWDVERKGEKKPKLMYIVPVGSNPTGSTMPGWRKQEIYSVCVKHDIIICEDDPYTFLQYPQEHITNVQFGQVQRKGAAEFVESLVPSFLKFDTQGRVIRLETFSKTLAPGSRLGYTIANPIFVERLLRASEVETQAPCGISQAIIYQLLQTWTTSGYLDWLSGLRDQYLIRRNWMLEALSDSFTSIPVTSFNSPPSGAEGLLCTLKSSPDVPLFSYTPPTGGMFIWLTFYLNTAARYSSKLLSDSKESSGKTKEEEFMNDLWESLANEGVLLTPGSYYLPYEGTQMGKKRREGEEGIGYFRLAFSMTTREEMVEAIKRMERVVADYWR